jgi:hypothetical protein
MGFILEWMNFTTVWIAAVLMSSPPSRAETPRAKAPEKPRTNVRQVRPVAVAPGAKVAANPALKICFESLSKWDGFATESRQAALETYLSGNRAECGKVSAKVDAQAPAPAKECASMSLGSIPGAMKLEFVKRARFSSNRAASESVQASKAALGAELKKGCELPSKKGMSPEQAECDWIARSAALAIKAESDALSPLIHNPDACNREFDRFKARFAAVPESCKKIPFKGFLGRSRGPLLGTWKGLVGAASLGDLMQNYLDTRIGFVRDYSCKPRK